MSSPFEHQLLRNAITPEAAAEPTTEVDLMDAVLANYKGDFLLAIDDFMVGADSLAINSTRVLSHRKRGIRSGGA